MSISRADDYDGTVGLYCQAFRNGIIESVDAVAVFGERGGQKLLGSVAYEEKLIRSVKGYLEALRELEIVLPATAMLAFVGAKGYHLAVSQQPWLREPTPIDRDLLILPDVLVEEYECDVPQLLRPIFDAVWNAAGWPRSMNYNEEGKWCPHQ